LCQVQEIFADCDAVRICLDMICAYKEFDYFGNYLCQKLFGALIIFFIDLLLAGNIKIQDKFYEYFEEEENSEKLFSLIYKIIEEEIK
jgi:hypothetical protein